MISLLLWLLLLKNSIESLFPSSNDLIVVINSDEDIEEEEEDEEKDEENSLFVRVSELRSL